VYGLDEKKTLDIFTQARIDLGEKKPGEPDTESIRMVKGMIRRGEAKSACDYLDIAEENVHFLDMPFYETGGIKKKPLAKEDIDILCDLIDSIEPHQIFAAGDLSDPHGTHRICYTAILQAMDRLSDRPWYKDCRIWLYARSLARMECGRCRYGRSLSPGRSIIKRNAIFRHQSQKDPAMFPGNDAPRVLETGRGKETTARPFCTTNWAWLNTKP